MNSENKSSFKSFLKLEKNNFTPTKIKSSKNIFPSKSPLHVKNQKSSSLFRPFKDTDDKKFMNFIVENKSIKTNNSIGQ